jgi:hypothetical protein
MNKPTIGVNEFVRRQTEASEFTHFEASLEVAANLAREFFDEAKPGYKEGVCLVPVPPEGFYTGVVELVEGDVLVGKYRARRPGEEPRKTTQVVRGRESKLRRLLRKLFGIKKASPKQACVAVDVVLYRKDVLDENNEATTDCEWEIVSINGRLTVEDQPIHPNTLIANHFGLDGGTLTGMSPEEFEAALKVSVLYWKNKATLATPETT